MCVNAGISCSPCEILIFSVWNMLMSSGISVFFGKSKVNNIHQIAFLSQSHQKVVWFHVSMDEIFGVYVFYSTNLNLKMSVQFGITGLANFTFTTSQISKIAFPFIFPLFKYIHHQFIFNKNIHNRQNQK